MQNALVMINTMMIELEKCRSCKTVEALKSGDVDGAEDQRRDQMHKSMLQNIKN